MFIFFVSYARAENSISIIEPKQIANKISDALPQNWSCEYDHSIIYISYNDEVTLLNPISLPSLESEEEILKDFGFKSQYIIMLHFTPRITDDVYTKMKNIQKDALNKIELDKSLDGKAKWDIMHRELKKHLLPKYYNFRYSIYFYRTDSNPLEVYPKSVAEERDVILNNIEKIFSNY